MTFTNTRYSFIFLVCILTMSLRAYPEVKVLFVGNSFTIGAGGNRSVPNIFDALANAAGQEDPTTVERLDGGKDYQYHYENNLGDILADQWTHVVLQNYSTEPTHVGSPSDHMTYGTLLYNALIGNHADTQVHLYQTWARAEAHSMISGTSTGSTFATTDEMLGELVLNYQALADALTLANPDRYPVVVNPVGEAWNHAGGNLPISDPDYFDLWGSDNYHGDNRGYYLSACIHYASIYKQSPAGLYTESEVQALGLSISNSEAAFLEDVAWRTVLDKGLSDQKLRIDFGADGSPTPDRGIAWNNLNATAAGSEITVLNDLQDVDGNATPIDLHVLSRFNSAFTDGTLVSTTYPTEASSDTLYGNTALLNGLSGITPQFKLTGLDPATAYTLSFYASAADNGSNLQTRYTLVGDRTLRVDLNAAGNVDSQATSAALYPNASGEITISLTPGPDNDSPGQLTLLGAMELTGYPEAALAFTTHPQSQSEEINAEVTFSAEGSAGRFVSYQWFRNGAAISGATEETYTLLNAPAAYNGSLYTVRVSNGLFDLESNAATLTLAPDSVHPEFSTLRTSGGNMLALEFSEPMDPATATDPAHFNIANRGQRMVISSITLSQDGRTVEITLAEEPEGNILVEATTEVKDTSGNSLSEATVKSILGPASGTTLLLDFGGGSTPDEPDETWNSFQFSSAARDAAGNGTGSAQTLSASLLDSEGTPSGIALSMSDAMSGTNGYGTTSGPYPSEATSDNYYGSSGSWGGFVDNSQGIFVFANLDPEREYDFTLFGSRTGVSDNRETRYALTGENSGSADLNASNNDSTTVAVTGIIPNAAGEITLTVSVGPNNDNSNGFYYLTVLEITVRDSREIPQMFSPVSFSAGVALDWSGTGTLHTTEDLKTPWVEVDPAPTAPCLIPRPSGNTGFYKLSY